jgi:hypothetical protein
METSEGSDAVASPSSVLGIVDAEKALEANVNSGSNGSQLKPVVTAQDWIGPNDPENPQNWSSSKKIYHAMIPTLLAFVV